LVENGVLITNEPVMPNKTTNAEYVEKYDLVQDIMGLKIRNGDRVDRFYREAEYITAAAYAGLDLVFLEEFAHAKPTKSTIPRAINFFKQRGIVEFIKKLLSKLTATNSEVSYKKDRYRELTANVKTKVMLFKKSKVPYIPHKWRGLD
jgi:hypothetical protein